MTTTRDQAKRIAILQEMQEIGRAKLAIQQRLPADYPTQVCASCHLSITDCICAFYAAIDDERPVPPEATDSVWDMALAFVAGMAVMGIVSWLVEAIW